MDPPLTANQKRKRGRPTNASRGAQPKDASNSAATIVPQQTQPDADGESADGGVDVESRPRKRGRRTKNDIPQQSQPEPSEPQPGKQKRRQPAVVQAEDLPLDQAGGFKPLKEAKTASRGRPKKGTRRAKPPEPEADEADDENDNQDEGNSSLLRRSNRNRHSSDGSPTGPTTSVVQEKLAGSLTARQTAKGRKRPARAVDKAQPKEEAGPKTGVQSASRAQKRTKKGTRPSQDTHPATNEAAEPILPREKQGRQSKPRGSDGESNTGPRGELSRPSATHRKLKARRQSSEAQDQSPARSSSPDSVSSPPPYRHIAERTRRVTHEVIESKWSSLDPSSVANVANLLHAVSLPTLLHVMPKQYAHAENILKKVIRGLCKRSARLPFPPNSTLPRREDELDFERTQSGVEALLSQLDPLQHSVELLRREKERAEKELEREYKVLDRLSTNARAEARERRDRLRKVHVLVPETAYGSATDNMDLLPADKTTGRVFASLQDEELLSLAGQINSHMESMRGNLQQIDGVLPAIAESHALLKTTLQPQFSQKQLEGIVLG